MTKAGHAFVVVNGIFGIGEEIQYMLLAMS
jgi:hypothetical protein